MLRVREGRAGRESITAWDIQLARVGIALMADRRQAVGLITDLFMEIAGGLGLDGSVGLAYRPRSRSLDEAGSSLNWGSDGRRPAARVHDAWPPP